MSSQNEAGCGEADLNDSDSGDANSDRVVRVGVLAAEGSAYARRLQAAADQLPQVELSVHGFDQLTTRLGMPAGRRSSASDSDYRKAGACCGGELGRADAILVRTMPLGSLEQVVYRMDALQLVQAAGQLVINAPRALEVAVDKWLTLQRLSAAGVAVPATLACQTRTQAMEAVDELGGHVVVKPLFGGEGRGLMLIDDRDLAWRVFGTLQQNHSVLYLQQWAPHLGYDIRVLWVGEDSWAIRRYAADGQWRTNLACGGRAEQHELNQQQHDVARQAAKAIGAEVVGVDLLPGQDGQLRVLEVNAVPGWAGVDQVYGCDIARRVLEYVSQRVKENRHAVRGD